MLLAGSMLGAAAGQLAPAKAQGRQISIVRDTEIEQLLREYSAPIFRAAGVNASQTDIVLIQDRTFNAFVANGRRIFMNVGVLLEADTPNEVIGVIAHETGHIAGGRKCRRPRSLRRLACWPELVLSSAQPAAETALAMLA